MSMIPTDEELVLIPHKFPVNEVGSIIFAVSKIRVEKASIEVNGAVLSTVKPKYASPDEIPESTNIPFFGDKPFHRALVSRCAVSVTLYTYDDGVPSLMLDISNTLTWTGLKLSRGLIVEEYLDRVVVGSDAGEKTLMLIYTPSQCGYTDKLS